MAEVRERPELDFGAICQRRQVPDLNKLVVYIDRGIDPRGHEADLPPF